MKNPAISVVIPMYNAEEFIGECLDSLLMQTFQDFEVIVVDDCSTDNSVALVESYAPKFDGRLTLTHTETNSGGGGYVPRNIGLSMASGEYVYFMDADDFIMLNALETLHAAAKEYNADVVYIAAYYWLKDSVKISAKRDVIAEDLRAQGLEDKPTLIVDAPEKILSEIIIRNHHRTPWAKFLRRDLLTENNIVFPKIILGGDVLWSFRVYAHAKRFLRLPTPVYFLRRYHTTSVIKTRRSVTGYNPELNRGFIEWVKTFVALASRIKFFRENVELCAQSVKDYFEYFVKNLYEEDRVRCFNDIRDTLLGELPATESDTAAFIKAFVQAVEADKKSYRPSTCAVSVVVSLYNYGMYIGDCLDSLLAQTFADFEVIVVDDCSTDNSYEVAKSYIPKFNGRLKLTRTKKNSGGGGMPRNIGLSLASGEYVFFMDADDALVPEGLAEMHAFAKEYYADVVYCEKYFISTGTGQEFKDNVHIADIKCQKPPYVNEPTIETDDMSKRVDRAVKFNYWVTAWLRLVRRDLLIYNDIKFWSLIGSNDVGWTYQVLFCARRFLRVPNAYYIRRVHAASVSFRKRTVSEHVHKWMDRTIRSFKYMDEFMMKVNSLKDNPRLRYKIFNHFVNSDFCNILEECQSLQPFEIAGIFRKKFGDYLGEHAVLVSCLCANINAKFKRRQRDEQRIAKLTEQLEKVKQSQSNFPAISVVIPMYNAEEFIGECLDSLLIQTFQDFEVIVVDDCSTDNSRTIVMSYAPKFKGRLKLTRMKNNSGGGGYVPRNIGLKHARGEYVFFLDADDFILGNALKTLYAAAKKFTADVVCTSAYYNLEGVNEVRRVRDKVAKDSPLRLVGNKPLLTIDDPNANLQNLFAAENMPATWRKFIRRDFLIENEIAFPEIINGGDFIWTIELYCRAERLLRVSTPIYFYRSYTPESVLRKQRPREEQISYWVSAFVAWARALNDLAHREEILRENPEYCHRALMIKFSWCNGHLAEEVKRLYASRIYGILCNEFDKANDSPDLSTLAFFFGQSVLNKRRITKLKERVEALESELERLKGKG